VTIYVNQVIINNVKEKPWTSAYNKTWEWRKDAYGSRKIVATIMARSGIIELTQVLIGSFEDLDRATS